VAEKSNAAKTEFLAHISHEIRTPMSAILSLTELLLNTPLDDQQRALLMKSKSAGRLLLGIINDILDLSKLEHGKLELAQIPFDLHDVLQQVSDLVSDACAIKGLRYGVEIAPDVVMHRIGDSQRLAQVLLNLVGNAVKFTTHGHVQVSVRCLSGDASGEYLRFEVQDSGIGLAPPLQVRVFEGFVQGDNEHTRSSGGTGLGLSICKRLAEQMNGEVGVESQEGVGSTFWFTVRLPLSHADRVADAQDARVGQAPASVLGVRVLLVEDNVSMRGILKQLLELAGAQVDTAENGQVASQMVNDTRYDLVLMDMQMPVMDGLEATRLIRRNPAHEALPIVALTAGGFNDDRSDCLAAGMNDYLMKPFEYQDLIQVLQRNVRALKHQV
jgi:CheY-like chemotaxis protein